MPEDVWSKISSKDRTFIIAEAGVNHNGDINKAQELVDVALSSGVDAIKFQSFKADLICTKNASKSTYQLTSTNKEESFYEMVSKLELSYEDHIILKE